MKRQRPKDGVMSHTIPEQIVAAAQELAEALGAWCTEGQNQSLAAHEAAVMDRVRAALPRLLEAVLVSATSGLHPRLARAPQRCPGCGRRTRSWLSAACSSWRPYGAL